MDFYKLSDRAIDSILGIFFDKDKTRLWLFLLIIGGLLIRLIAAMNLSVLADDMHFVTHAINFLSAGRLIAYDQSAGLWFAFTDVMFKLFGTDQVASRLAAVLFGTMTIPLMYLLTREFFTKRVALAAALLTAIAPFAIKSMMAEMDVMVMFFSLLAFLFLVRGLKSGKKLTLLLAGVALGLAIYTKVYALMFIPSMLVYAIYTHKRTTGAFFSSKLVKSVLIVLAIAFLFTIPSLAHNILLYLSKGFMDLQFTRQFGIGEDISAQYYSFDPIFREDNRGNVWKALILGGENPHDSTGLPLLFVAVRYLWWTSPLICVLGVIGLLTLFFKRQDKGLRDYVVFYLSATLFILLFLASLILLPKHYIFLELLITPLAAYAFVMIGDALTKYAPKFAYPALIIASILFVLIFLGAPTRGVASHVYGTSYIQQLIEFKESSIPENTLVVMDSRFYRGQIYWSLQGRSFIEASQFAEIMSQQDQLPGATNTRDIYYVECVPEDCGWGSISSQPDFNASMEYLTEAFATQGSLVDTISAPTPGQSYYPFISSEKKMPFVKVYRARIPMKDAVLIFANQPKNWFLYNIGYPVPQQEFDAYTVDGAASWILDRLAHFMVWISVICAFISLMWVGFQALRRHN